MAESEVAGTASASSTATATTTTTRASRKKRKVYDEEVDGFAFTRRSKRLSDRVAATNDAAVAAPAPAEAQPVKPTRRSFATVTTTTTPTTTAEPKSTRPKATKPRQAERSPQPTPVIAVQKRPRATPSKSPAKPPAKPQTKTPAQPPGSQARRDAKPATRIRLPFQETPVIRRNKEMRKTRAEGGSRRSSAGMRGRRASSLIDEGRSALPHAEVPSSEFYKHISADIPEPRRMRCLLGWCATRTLPASASEEKQNEVGAGDDAAAIEDLESQARRTARIIQEELAQDLVSKGSLSDWFSRDDDPPALATLRKKPNPRNVANALKAEELEKELERLQRQRREWDELKASVARAAPESPPTPPDGQASPSAVDTSLSPLDPAVLDTPQRRIYEQLRNSERTTSKIATDPTPLQQRLRQVSETLEFTVDRFAHGVHALSTARETGERLAEHTLAAASDVLDARERDRHAADGKPPVDPMVALRGLAKVLNG